MGVFLGMVGNNVIGEGDVSFGKSMYCSGEQIQEILLFPLDFCDSAFDES